MKVFKLCSLKWMYLVTFLSVIIAYRMINKYDPMSSISRKCSQSASGCVLWHSQSCGRLCMLEVHVTTMSADHTHTFHTTDRSPGVNLPLRWCIDPSALLVLRCAAWLLSCFLLCVCVCVCVKCVCNSAVVTLLWPPCSSLWLSPTERHLCM